MEETENNTDNKKDLTMENNNFVTVEDFQKYTEYVSGVLNNVKESANSNNDEVIEKLIKYYKTGDLVTWDDYNLIWVKLVKGKPLQN